MFKKIIEKFTADAMFYWRNMTFNAIFNILYILCKY